MTARGECRLILWQHYDMIILLAQWYSIFRQNNSILINEHALIRKTVHGYVLWLTSRVEYLIIHGLVPSHRLFEIIHIKRKILKEKNLDFFSLNFFTLISYYQKWNSTREELKCCVHASPLGTLQKEIVYLPQHIADSYITAPSGCSITGTVPPGFKSRNQSGLSFKLTFTHS